MVLINNLTIDEINAALLHLQRSRSEIVGGDKGTTINNISVNNTGGGTSLDYGAIISVLKERIEKNAENIESLEEKNRQQDIQIQNIIALLDELEQNGVTSLFFNETDRKLVLTLEDGSTLETDIPSEEVNLTLDSSTNKLTFEMGSQTKEVTLPYINVSEKGAANGVATLDATGRVPYSQLPESAMEFLGEWNASTNTPHLQDGTGTNGDFYICSVAGTVNLGTTTQPREVTFYINDRIIYQGNENIWKRLPASEVREVNGMSGDVEITANDVPYDNNISVKTRLDNIAVQSNWTQSDNTKLDYIKNKPSLAAVATSGNYNDLANKPTIPAAQVQSDWNVTDTTSKAFIKNKPTIPAAQVQSNWNETNTSSKAYIQNKPTIPAAQIQSDWTQTDSTKKDFIKNKIPIWITSGSADDNMSPVDVVQNGNTRPVTSGGVANAMALPTDAVLHYSFDEVPDYPDGTADVRLLDNNTYDIQSTDAKFYSNGATITNNNGNVHIEIPTPPSSAAYSVYIANNSIKNKIVKIKINITSIATNGDVKVVNGTGNVVATFTKSGKYDVVLLGNQSTGVANNLYILTNTTYTAEVLAIYIGNGSYSTPIIDNANGEWNSISQSGIAVQGVSGKGLFFPSATQQIVVPFKAPTSNDNITVSLWLNVDTNYVGDGVYKAICCIGAFAGTFGLIRINNNIGFMARDSSNARVYNVLMDKGNWHNYAFVYKDRKADLFVDGVKVGYTAVNVADYQFGNNKSWYIWGNTIRGGEATRQTNQPAQIDDILFFDRALSEQEVLALYLNKANTPKYYPPLNIPASKIPFPPSTDGNYTLHVTVANGKPSYSWS